MTRYPGRPSRRCHDATEGIANGVNLFNAAVPAAPTPVGWASGAVTQSTETLIAYCGPIYSVDSSGRYRSWPR